MPVPEDEPETLHQGFIQGSGKVKHVDTVSKVFIWAS